VLNTLLRVIGISNREVERRLGLHPSSLTRFFNGQVEAKLEVVLGMARVVGLEYEEFFNFAYPGRQDPESESPTARSIRLRLAGLQGAKPRPGAAQNPSQSPQKPEEKELSPEEVQRIARAVAKEMRRPGGKPKAGSGED
jgi:hypothetical protein